MNKLEALTNHWENTCPNFLLSPAMIDVIFNAMEDYADHEIENSKSFAQLPELDDLDFRELRLKNKLKLQEVCDATGIKPSSLSQIELHGSSPKYPTVRKLILFYQDYY